MKIFHHDSSQHAPQNYLADGTLRPCPDNPSRAQRIQHALQKLPSMQLQISSVPDPLPAIRAVHSPDYLHYLERIHAAWFRQFNCDVLPDTFLPRNSPTHLSPPKSLIAQPGYFCFDMAAPITAGTWQAALNSVGSALAATNAVLAGDRAAYAICRPPGHHAGHHYGGGFCYLNNIAIAAQHAIGSGKKRAAILDVDYHHGNGTQDIFYARDDVLTISIHADPDTQYPYYWGHASEQGHAAGHGANLNLPLPRNAPESQWFESLGIAIARLRKFSPEVLLISLGVDTCEGDGVGDFHLTLPGFQRLGHELAQLQLPTVLVQEGGYNVEKIGACVAAVLNGFESQS